MKNIYTSITALLLILIPATNFAQSVRPEVPYVYTITDRNEMMDIAAYDYLATAQSSLNEGSNVINNAAQLIQAEPAQQAINASNNSRHGKLEIRNIHSTAYFLGLIKKYGNNESDDLAAQ